MRKLFGFILAIGLFLQTPVASAQDEFTAPTTEWFHGTVTAVAEPTTTTSEATGESMETIDVSAQLSETNQTVSILVTPGSFGGSSGAGQYLRVGAPIIVTATTTNDETTYAISDYYRTPTIVVMVILFFVIVLVFARKKGFGSILGLGLTIFVLVKGVVPAIANGTDPILVSILGALVILGLSFYVAHGFNQRITIALISSCVVLAFATILSIVATHFAFLSGTSSEEVYFLQAEVIPNLDLKGLLLAGMIIGMLGVLDDITTGQAAVVEELHKANTKLSFKELYQRAQSVGREHIASLVNTLVLAYAGASLPLFLLFVLNPYQPVWTIFSSEVIAEEIVRALVGSIAILLAVPITTSIAAYWFTRPKTTTNSKA